METPVEARDYCPSCSPWVDPIREVVVVSWCGEHRPVTEGDIREVRPPAQSMVCSEGDGEVGRAFAEWQRDVRRWKDQGEW